MGFVPAVCPDDCVYRTTINGHLPSCGYVFITGKLRGCDPGPGCTRYTGTRDHHKPRKGKAPTWDVGLGQKMWAEGYTSAQIGKKLGVSRETVSEYCKRNWGEINRQRHKRK